MGGLYLPITEGLRSAYKVYNKLGYGFLKSVYPPTQKVLRRGVRLLRFASGKAGRRWRYHEKALLIELKNRVNPVHPVEKE